MGAAVGGSVGLLLIAGLVYYFIFRTRKEEVALLKPFDPKAGGTEQLFLPGSASNRVSPQATRDVKGSLVIPYVAEPYKSSSSPEKLTSI